MKRPKRVWGNAVNLSGLWSLTPMRLRWHADLKEWYDSSGNFSVAKLGIREDDGRTTCASPNKSDVKNWTRGVLATMRMLRVWLR